VGVWACGGAVHTADAAVRGNRSLTACLEARQPLLVACPCAWQLTLLAGCLPSAWQQLVGCLPQCVAATCWLPARRVAATCWLLAPARGSYLLAACPELGSHLLVAVAVGPKPGGFGGDGRARVRVGLAHALLRPKACMTLPAAMNLGHEPRTYGDLGIPAILAGTMKAPPRKLWKHHVPSAVGQEILAESHPPVACGWKDARLPQAQRRARARARLARVRVRGGSAAPGLDGARVSPRIFDKVVKCDLKIKKTVP